MDNLCSWLVLVVLHAITSGANTLRFVPNIHLAAFFAGEVNLHANVVFHTFTVQQRLDLRQLFVMGQ